MWRFKKKVKRHKIPLLKEGGVKTWADYPQFQVIDIAADLTHEKFEGIYDGTRYHQPDLDCVLKRAKKEQVKRIVLKGTSLSQSAKALELARTNDKFFSTVGCAAINTPELKGDYRKYLEGMRELIENNRDKVVALGECGLDYLKLKIVNRETQINYFIKQIQLAKYLEIPLIVRAKIGGEDVYRALKMYYGESPDVVIHSYDGTRDEAKRFLDMGYKIGLSGCSIKTEKARDLIAELPVKHIMVGSDSPICEIWPSKHYLEPYYKVHFFRERKPKWCPDRLVKGRCEPSMTYQILEIAAALKETNEVKMADEVYETTMKFFRWPLYVE